MLALAYLVKHHIVNVENRVRDPESTIKTELIIKTDYPLHLDNLSNPWFRQYWFVTQSDWSIPLWAGEL